MCLCIELSLYVVRWLFLLLFVFSSERMLCDYVCRDVIDEMEEDKGMEEDKRMDEVKIEEHPLS